MGKLSILALICLLACRQPAPPAIATEGEYEYQSHLVANATTADNITSVQWRQLTGPAPATILCATCPSTQVTNLQLGIYSFEFSVTNQFGTGRDTMQLTVLAPPLLVRLLSFTGKTNEFYNEIEWQAENTEPVTFELLRNGRVIHTTTMHSWKHKDYGFEPISRYQLRQTDAAGKIALSEILLLANRPRTEKLLVSKSANQLHITFISAYRQQATLRVFNTAGALYAAETFAADIGANRRTVPIAAAGIIIVQVQFNNQTLIQKIR